MTKLFVQESGSDRLIRHMREVKAGQKVVSELTLLEVRSAIRRRERSGDLLLRDGELALRALEEEARRVRVYPLSSSLVLQAGALVDRHRLKALDSLQLASALEIAGAVASSLLFVGCDLFLLHAAVGEGLQIWNPEDL